MEKKMQWIGYAAGVLFCAAFPFLLNWMRSQPLLDITTILFSICCVTIAVFTNTIFHKVLVYNSNKSVEQLKKRLVPSYLFYVFITILFALSAFTLMYYLTYEINGWDTTDFWGHLFRYQFPGVIASILMGISISTIAFFFTVWRQAIGREQNLQEETLKYKYKNLKAQVNPHFLFNSLNTLSEIVYVNARRADHYIQKLAGIYRYILDHEDTDRVPLQEELEFVTAYFDLQKERDGNKVHLDISIDNINQFKIIPISLQILVENALKHNSASDGDPLVISITGNNGEYIVVSNPIRKRTTLNSSHGTGLTNLKERVKLIIGKEMIIETKNNRFTVKLPIMKV